MIANTDPRHIAIPVACFLGLLLLLALMLRARTSRYPALLWTCAAYMALLHAVWIWGLLTSRLFESGFASMELLTFPWSMAVIFNRTMAGFGSTPSLLLNYFRFVLGFGGLQCLLLTLFVWELKLQPRRIPGSRPRSRSHAGQ